MGPAFAIVERDALTLWLSGPQTSAARPMPDGEKPVPGGWNRLVLEVDDVETELTRVVTAGIEPRGDILRGPGGSQVVVRDGEGNLIEFFSPR
jgi:catechol 2,3-dioxygenase-like lactoylglutathione lyase family enzyme